jgi:two-component system catabolic regulation response regulator CreB
VLVVEDEPGIADTIRYALATDGFEPCCVGTGAEALAALDAAVALVILDVGLPDVNGFELFRRLQAKREVPVVFLTARSDVVDRVVGLELGADDYLAKPFSPRELVARVRTVLRRAGRPAAPGTAAAAAVALVIDAERRLATYYGRPLDLTRYEFGLLRTLASRPGRVWSRDELLAQVWGDDTDSIDRTVDAHVKTVRAKLRAVVPEVDAIVTHRGSGYALLDPLPPAGRRDGP